MVIPPVGNLKCPACGGPLTRPPKGRGIVCSHCGTQCTVPTGGLDSCACGLQGVGHCVQCDEPLCGKHLFTLKQFDLARMIGNYCPSRIRETRVLIEALHQEQGPERSLCADCVDALLERWLGAMQALPVRQGERREE